LLLLLGLLVLLLLLVVVVAPAAAVEVLLLGGCVSQLLVLVVARLLLLVLPSVLVGASAQAAVRSAGWSCRMIESSGGSTVLQGGLEGAQVCVAIAGNSQTLREGPVLRVILEPCCPVLHAFIMTTISITQGKLTVQYYM
jgi:hypothetical protein